jgi:2,4-dienoyl-CoA reductase-like NADH-dependent reductase (Old Yellow Enzyme family)
MSESSSLHRPGNIGPLQLKNRVIMAAMGVTLAGPEGEVSDKMIAF